MYKHVSADEKQYIFAIIKNKNNEILDDKFFESNNFNIKEFVKFVLKMKQYFDEIVEYLRDKYDIFNVPNEYKMCLLSISTKVHAENYHSWYYK